MPRGATPKSHLINKHNAAFATKERLERKYQMGLTKAEREERDKARDTTSRILEGRITEAARVAGDSSKHLTAKTGTPIKTGPLATAGKNLKAIGQLVGVAKADPPKPKLTNRRLSTNVEDRRGVPASEWKVRLKGPKPRPKAVVPKYKLPPLADPDGRPKPRPK